MKKSKTILYLLCTFLYWFSLYTYVPLIPTYLETLSIPYKTIGIIIGAYGFSQMLLRIPLGIFSDKLGQRKPFIFSGLALSVLASVLFLSGQSALYAFLGRFIAGLAASSWVVFTVLYSSYFDKKHTAKAIGFITATSSAGQFVATLVGPILKIRGALILSIVFGIIGMLLSLTIKENHQIERKPLSLKDIFSNFKNKRLLTGSILGIFVQFIVFATVYGFTQIHAGNLGATDFELGLLVTLATIPGIFASSLSGAFFEKRFGTRKSILMGLTVLTISTIAIGFTNSLATLFIFQILSGFSRWLVFPLLMSMSIKDVDHQKRGASMGFFQAVYGIGMFLGPVATGFFSDFSSLTWGFIFVGTIGLISLFLGYKHCTDT